MDIENLFRKGNSYKIIASKLGISEGEVQHYCWSRYKTGEMDRAAYKGTVARYVAYGEEDYLFLVQKYKKVEKYLKCTKKDNLPPIKWILEKYDNSWKAAFTEASRDDFNEKEATTLLYLVYFEHEDFYKVGITGYNTYTRFKSHPSCHEVDSILLPKDRALAYETEILSKVEQYIPIKFGDSGHTECFKSDVKIDSLSYFTEELNMAWTAEEENYLIKMYDKGVPNKEIAKTLDKPLGTVNNKCTRMGLSRMSRWSEDDIKSLIDMSNEGFTSRRMAIRLGRTEAAIEKKISRLMAARLK